MPSIAALIIGAAPLATASLPAGPAAHDLAVLRDLLPSASAEVRADAFAAAGRDVAFLPPLLDLLALAATRGEWFMILDAIGEIRGEDVRDVERPWRTFQTELAGGAKTPLPLGYAGFKGELLGQRVAPEFARLLPAGIDFDGRLDQLHFGGVGPRGIPALTDPGFVGPDEAEYVADDAPVIGIARGDEARAYPLQIIDWHEMVNDVIDGTPVALTWCTLCNAAIAYRAETGSGERLVFGSSGLLLRSNKVMFDKGTGSLWSQLEGRRLSRQRLGAEPLDRLPARMTTWGRWRAEHPESRVLAEDTGHDRDYRIGAAYGDMFVAPATMFPVAEPADAELGTKDAVVVIDGSAVVPAAKLHGEALVHVNDRYILMGPGLLDEPRLHVVVDARAWRSGGHRFEAREAGFLVDETGRRWRVTHGALVSESGERLERVPSHVSFAFAAPR